MIEIKLSGLIKTIILSGLIFILSGCYDYNELNSLDIISGIGLTLNDNKYNVIYEVINTNLEKDNTDTKKSFIVNGEGDNLSEAILNANHKLSKKAYFEHIKVMIIDKNIDIIKLSDYLFRSNKISTNFYLVLADNPLEILSYTSEDKGINSTYIYDILKNINYTKIDNYFDFQINKILNKIDITIPKVEIDKRIIFKTYGLYHENNFVNYLDSFNLEMYSYFLDNAGFSASNDDGNTIYFYQNKTNIKLDSDITYNIKLKAKIDSLNTNFNLRDNKDFKKLEADFNKNISKDITNFIQYLKDNNTDILGINYKHYLKTKSVDNSYFQKTDFKVNMDIKINKPGLTVRRITNE